MIRRCWVSMVQRLCVCVCVCVSQELNGIEEELVSALTRGEGDAFCAYLLGVVLLDK